MVVTVLCAVSLIGVVQAMVTQVSTPGGDVVEYWGHPSPHGYIHYIAGIAQGAAVRADGDTFDLFFANGGTQEVAVYTFFNNYDVLGNMTSAPYVVPGNNYTILSVYAVALFVAGPVPPYGYLLYSQDYGTTYTQSPSNPHNPLAGGWSFAWNITSKQNWTPADLKSPAFAVKLVCGPSAGYHYYLDYVGLWYSWTSTGGGGPPGPPGGPGGLPWSIGGSWLINIVVLSMGGVGFIGMIACPAAMIKAHKKGSDKAEGIASAAILEMIFIGMLYAALVAF